MTEVNLYLYMYLLVVVQMIEQHIKPLIRHAGIVWSEFVSVEGKVAKVR